MFSKGYHKRKELLIMDKNQYTIVEPPRFVFTIIGEYDEEEAEVFTVATDRGKREIFDVTSCVTDGEEVFFELHAPCGAGVIKKTVVSRSGNQENEQSCALLLRGLNIRDDEGRECSLSAEMSDICGASQILLSDSESGEDMELWATGLPKFSFYIYDKTVRRGVLVDLDYARLDSGGFSVTRDTLRFEGYALLPGRMESTPVSGYYSYKDGCGVLRLKGSK